MRERWLLDEDVAFLNHGSFGACPEHVLDAQRQLRDRMEREPVRFFVRDLEGLIAEARAKVGAFVGASPEDFGFVRNATAGVNAVLRSLSFAPGDEILVTDHGYNACTNVARFVAERSGATVVTARIPFPLASEDEAIDAILASVTERTKLALLDHVTSPTGLVLPIEALVDELHRRHVDALIDGAHAPGMLPLDIEAIGAAYYTANFHKWVCAPKGAAMLWVRPDRQDAIHPAVISHGLNSARARKPFLEELDWQGTDDPTPPLCVPVALDYLASLVEGGWPSIRAQNRDKVLEGRSILCAALDVPPPTPDSMIGSLAAVPLPDSDGAPPLSALYADPLNIALADEERIQVPIVPWPAPGKRLVRISAYLYNTRQEYERLAAALLRHGPASGSPSR
ncbi:MAG: aminotransferase class V-fold PLP-dependent enzyme [Sandaracinaceae bacterium]